MLDALERLNLILDTITDGILVVDVQGIVLYANQAAEQLLERGALTGQSLAIPVSASPSKAHDINLIRRSGFAWAEMRSTPIEWDGSPAYVIGLRDITARKQAEIALQQSEALFQTLARLAPVGIFKTDPNGKCEYVNQRWCDISGLEAEAAYDESWMQAIFIDDQKRVYQEWQHVIESQSPLSSQYRFKHRNGSIHWVICRTTPEYDCNQHLLGYVGTRHRYYRHQAQRSPSTPGRGRI